MDGKYSTKHLFTHKYSTNTHICVVESMVENFKA